MSRKSRLLFLPLLIFVSMTAMFYRGLSGDPRYLPSTKIGKVLPDLSLPLLGEKALRSITSNPGQGWYLLVVWASWCEACQQEQPFLMQLQKQGFPLVGLNYKDSPEEAQQWLQKFGNPYRFVLQDWSGRAAIELGFYGAPESFLLDPQGRLRYRHSGILSQSLWQEKFMPLMEKGE